MNAAHKPLLVIGVAIALLAAISLRNNGSSAPELVPWRDDYTAAKAEAIAANKPLLVYFTASWCDPCKSMKRTTWNDESVKAAMEPYVPVKVDVDTNRDLADRFRIQSVPNFYIIDGTGKAVKHTEGAMRATEMVAWLRRS